MNSCSTSSSILNNEKHSTYNNIGSSDDPVTNSDRGVKRTFEDDSTAHYPKSLKEMFGPLKCDLCGVETNSSLIAYTHYKGKSHGKKVDKYLRENNINIDTPNKKTKNEFVSTTCELCNVELTSKLQSLQHMSGKAHKKKMLNGNVKIPVKSAESDETGRFGIGTSFCPPSSSQDSEIVPSGSNMHAHFCTVCNIFTTSPEALKAHREGAKHQKKIAHEKSTHLNALSKYRTPSDYYYCSLCNVSANSADQFLIHMQSKKHNTKKKNNT